MLTAVPSENSRSLEVFKLVISMFRDDARSVPEHLKSYFDLTLGQAINLSKGLWSEVPDPKPEAIHLAMYLVNSEEVGESFKSVSSFKQLNHELAERILASMERRLAA